VFCAWYVTCVVKGEHPSPVGPRIREARDAAGLTQVALAERLGQGERTIQAWEINERTPRLDALRKLALALGKDLAWFYTELEEAAA